jgi:phosphoribosyl 1,2-cyclic phosphodiesterase
MGDPLLNVSFFGVRGSTPCSCDDNRRYGGNTSCVALEAPGHAPIVLDLGTGLRFWGETLDRDTPFVGSALVTHIHWDHVQGLPFFTPVLKPGASFDIYGPPQVEEGSLGDAFAEFMRPPFFPVTTKDLLGDIRFHDVDNVDLELDGAKVKVRPVPHVGLTNGYRVEMGGATVAYLSDHQMPVDGSHDVSDAVLELCDGVDVLIHDAQYTVEEFPQKATWGHCTSDYAVHVAKEAGARRLVLFHHDPLHDDDFVDGIVEYASALPEADGIEVIGAREGLVISFP